VQPAPAKACGSDESDPTGSDSSCGGNDNSGDNQAGDRPGDGGD
jgi:hypothetical protein